MPHAFYIPLNFSCIHSLPSGAWTGFSTSGDSVGGVRESWGPIEERMKGFWDVWDEGWGHRLFHPSLSLFSSPPFRQVARPQRLCFFSLSLWTPRLKITITSCTFQREPWDWDGCYLGDHTWDECAMRVHWTWRDERWPWTESQSTLRVTWQMFDSESLFTCVFGAFVEKLWAFNCTFSFALHCSISRYLW